MPEEVCGAVLEQDDREVVLDVGFPINLSLPEGSAPTQRIYAKLRPPLLADDAELI